MAKKLKWPTGPVSKAQWRWWWVQAHKGNPTAVKWAHRITERGEKLGPKVHYRSLPRYRRGPGGAALRHPPGGVKRGPKRLG